MKNLKYIENPKEFFREQRETVCFPIINRGKLWYDTLTFEQLGELKSWYWKWLNVTETLEIPIMPEWLNSKIVEEELL